MLQPHGQAIKVAHNADNAGQGNTHEGFQGVEYSREMHTQYFVQKDRKFRNKNSILRMKKLSNAQWQKR